jgi:predicted porin
MMKKSLIALALVAAAPVAFAATSNVDVYGLIGQEISAVDAKFNYGKFTVNTDTTLVGDSLFNGSKVGFKGSEDLGGGMAAIWQIETAINTDSNTSASANQLANRNTFIGLKGAFGTVLAGRHDSPEKLSTGSNDFFGDTAGDYNAMIIDTRENNVVAYVSPNFSGFHAAIAGVAGETVANDSMANTLSYTLVYENGPFKGSYARTTADKGTTLNGNSKVTAYAGDIAATIATDDGDLTIDRMGASYAMGDIKMAVTHQKVKETNGLDYAATVAGASYAMGPIVAKLQYGQADDKTASNLDANQITVGVDYNLSKRTSVYALHSKLEGDGGTINGLEVKITSIGMKHSF